MKEKKKKSITLTGTLAVSLNVLTLCRTFSVQMPLKISAYLMLLNTYGVQKENGIEDIKGGMVLK